MTTVKETVYWCKGCEVIRTSTVSMVCPACAVLMEDTGWFEYSVDAGWFDNDSHDSHIDA